MIIGKILGGLGNQMFCYAYARSLQLKYKDNLILDCSVYNKYKIRNYSLDKLNIPDSIKQTNEVDLSFFLRQYYYATQKLYHVMYKLIKHAYYNDKIGSKLFKFLGKRGLYYNLDRFYYPSALSNKEKKYTYGYFQSEKYFEEYKNQIRSELKVKIEPTEKEQRVINDIVNKNTNSVGVSIRYGQDYLKSNLNVCDKEYYYKAMDLMASKLSNPIFYIFSDCIDDIKRDFNFKYPVYYVQGFKDYESLRLLYTCSNFIIANSSFSWWGAYLSDYKEKIVISPSKWYKDTNEKPDIYYDSMVLIDV